MLEDEYQGVDQAEHWIGEFIERLREADRHKYSVFQLERAPRTGRLHLQGYSELTGTARYKWIQSHWPNFGSAHFEVRQGSRDQAINYCKKDESRISGPWEIGDNYGQGKRTELDEIAREIREGKTMEYIAKTYPKSFVRYARGIERLDQLTGPKRKIDWNIEVTVYWGTSGSGKTTKAKENFPNAYVWMPQRGQTVWWDGYAGEDTIIIDEFASNFQYHYALRILNEPGVRVETKGGTTCLYAKRIVITSMDSPLNWWPSVKENRYALYRRIHKCYRFTGKAEKGTSIMEVDYFPIEFESNPDNMFEPRKWYKEVYVPEVIPEPEIIEIPSPEELPRFNSDLWEWDHGSTESFDLGLDA